MSNKGESGKKQERKYTEQISILREACDVCKGFPHRRESKLAQADSIVHLPFVPSRPSFQVLDHMGPPVNIFSNAQNYDTWLSSLRLLAPHNNIAVKLSCLMPVIGSQFHLSRVTPYIQAGGTAREIALSTFGKMIRDAINVFGVDRCMWASNYPSDKPSARFGELAACTWMILKELMVDKDGRRKVMRENAVRIYGLNLGKPVMGNSKGVQNVEVKL